jgi:hypothetical protein
MAMERADWATVARLAGVSLLFTGWIAMLVARSGAMSRDAVGSLVFLIGVAMLAAHIALRRLGGRSPEAAIAALLGSVAVPGGLIAALWTAPAVEESPFDVVEPGSVGNALLISAVVFTAAWLLAREPRWLLLIPLVAVAGVQLRLTSAGVGELGGGGGDWPRFLVLLAAIAALVAVARRTPDAERRNLSIAAALLVPAAFLSVPVADGPSVARDVAGIAFLAGLAWPASRRASPGIGFAILATAALEVVSLNQHGDTVLPGLLVLAAGAALAAWGTAVFFGARHQKKRSVPVEQ